MNFLTNWLTEPSKEAQILEVTVQCEKEAFIEYLEDLDPERNQSQLEWNTDVYHPERLSDQSVFI